MNDPVEQAQAGYFRQIFEEAALDSRLQAGQLDAASAYLSQAKQLHLHYIMLPATGLLL